MAYSAVISLKWTFEHVLNPTDPLTSEITNSVYEELESLGNTLKRLDGSTIYRGAIDELDAQIRENVWKLEDLVESYVLYQSLPPSDGVAKGYRRIPPMYEQGVEQEIFSFLKKVKVLKFNYYREVADVSRRGDNFGGNKSTMVGLSDQSVKGDERYELILAEEVKRQNEESAVFLDVDKKDVEKEMDSFLMTLEKFEEEYITELENPLPGEEDDVDSPIDNNFGGKKSMSVGLSDQFKKIRNELLDRKPGLKVVSLVGMAGIGKTYLARKVYEHPTISGNFDLKAWVRVGPRDQIKNALVDIVAQIERKPRNLYVGKDVHTLGSLLQQRLHQRRYLIVLDDVWNTRVCNTLIWWLPSDGNGKRLLLTTRLEEVAKCHNTSIHQMPFLNIEQSSKLLCQNVFPEKFFPRHLEGVGSKIAEKCEGLPLLILAVANILCGVEKTEEYWKKVADNRTTTFVDACDKISKVLSSSYEYLPQHLKACFLYMGVFPQGYEIPLSKLINLWNVEDILEQTSEDFSVECLEKMVSKNLVIVDKQISDYKIKSLKLHSAHWHLCVKEARKNNFLHVLNKLTDVAIERPRRLSVQNSTLFGMKEVYESMKVSLGVRSLFCTGQYHKYPVPICFDDLMLLKVLDALAIRFYKFPIEVLKLLQLKYLALTHNGNLPSSISKLQNLQSLIVNQHRSIKLKEESTYLPYEIWDMQELRHLQIMGSKLLDPSDGAQLPNLLTLYVKAHSCTEAVFKSMPKLKKLGIKIELEPRSAEILSCFEHVSILHELESLKCVVVNPRLRSQVVAPPDPVSSFPMGLKKLSLNGIGYSWEYISAIGSLPNLQVLKLRRSAFRGPEWETRAEEFPRLKFLVLEDIDLVHWKIAGDDCFPSLQRLSIRHCYKLKEIPSQIAIPTLEMIEVVDCIPSVEASAQKVQKLKKRKSSLKVVINSSWHL